MYTTYMRHNNQRLLGGTGEGKYAIHDIFDVPNTAFSVVLVLVGRFTCAGFNTICMKNVF